MHTVMLNFVQFERNYSTMPFTKLEASARYEVKIQHYEFPIELDLNETSLVSDSCGACH